MTTCALCAGPLPCKACTPRYTGPVLTKERLRNALNRKDLSEGQRLSIKWVLYGR